MIDSDTIELEFFIFGLNFFFFFGEI